MMNLAIAVFEERISVVFDNSSHLLLVSFNDNLVNNTRRISCNTCCTSEVVEVLKSESVEILICGAISNSMQQMIENNGIRIISWISGSVAQVMEAFFSDALDSFLMPGCCRGW